MFPITNCIPLELSGIIVEVIIYCFNNMEQQSGRYKKTDINIFLPDFIACFVESVIQHFPH